MDYGVERSSIGPSDDCADSRIRFEDPGNLTPSERAALMDEAFFDALGRYDACQDSKKRSDEGSSSGSHAASGISGSEEGEGAGGNAPSPNSEWAPDDQMPVEDGNPDEPAMANNGKVPDDIPPADNDGVLEAQIRKAAMAETDPKIKKQLWDEYRKYKGLPVQN